jgi:alkylation response protein AidB-like acyl-CoA dehydrogenase
VQLKLSEMHMLTEALRSFVMRTAWERDRAVAGDKGLRNSPNAGLVMNFSQPMVQRVTALNMDIHGPEGAMMNLAVDKLVRDAMIWTHLAGDSVQRMRSLRHVLH